MARLTDDMKRVVREQRLGFWATVGEDGLPNLSPKGTTCVWDDEHLACADVCSPRTAANVRRGSWAEVNVVDPFVRKGYRFKGPARLVERDSPGFADGLERLAAAGVRSIDRVNTIVVLDVERAEALISPAYDDRTASEADLVARYQVHYAALHAQRADWRT